MSTVPALDPPGWVQWPEALPDCTTRFDEQSVDLRVRTEMEVGPPKTRRRYTSPMRRISCSMVIEKLYVPTLRSFYEGSGESSNHVGGTEGGYRFFNFKSPLDNEVHYYRFLTPPKLTNAGPLHCNVSMEWEEL